MDFHGRIVREKPVLHLFYSLRGNVGKRIFFLSGGDTHNMIGETAARCVINVISLLKTQFAELLDV